MNWKQFLKRIECPVDEDGTYVNNSLTNRDLIPIPPERRTWGITEYASYWSIQGVSTSGYTIGATLLAYGLTAQQAIACLIAGAIFTGITSVACGWMGEKHHIGFTVASRFSYGIYGSYIAVILRSFSTIFWFGLQAYWGGQAMAVALGALSPHFRTMESSIPASSNITTQDLVGLILYYVFFIPIAYIPPEKLRIPFLVCSGMFIASVIGMLAWSVSQAGGGGPLFHTENTAENTGWSVAFAITVVTSVWATGMLGQSDLTRYSSRRYVPTLSQLIACPVFMLIGGLCGVVITSAASQIIGEVVWTPYSMLSAAQATYNDSSRARVGVFFAAIGCVAAQIIQNLIVNCISIGMDCAGLWPKYLNIRRGTYITAALGIAVTPWNIVASTNSFYTFLNGFAILLAPMMAILCADYLVIYKQRLVMLDLYDNSKDSVYWFTNGFNYRSLFSFLMGVWPMLPGLHFLMKDAAADGPWVRLFNLSMFVGFFITFFLQIGICMIWPMPGQGQGDSILDDTIFATGFSKQRAPAASPMASASFDEDDKKDLE